MEDIKPPQWAIERALILLGQWGNLGVDTHPATYAFARYIAQHEQPPVDPDVIAVREILAAFYRGTGGPGERYGSGEFDDLECFQAALAAFRKHKGQQ